MNLRILLVLFCTITSVAHAQTAGPGVPRTTFATGELFTVLARFDSTNNNAPGRHGTAIMHDGYLGIARDQGFNFYNISNPRSPVLVKRVDHTNIREQHAIGNTYFNGKKYVISQAKTGIVIWDITDVANPLIVSDFVLPGATAGDYDSAVWWIASQGAYVYVSGTGNGVYIVDISNPASPVLRKQVAASSLGTFRGNTIFVVGNLMVRTTADGGNVPGASIATYDISDPINPVLLQQRNDFGGYSAMLNANKVFQAGAGMEFFDITNPQGMIRNPATTTYNNGYLTFQDNFVHAGTSDDYKKINIGNTNAYSIVGTATKASVGFEDLDFCSVIGQFVVLGDDHGKGSVLLAHSTTADSTPPAVNMVIPKNGATSQNTKSRIGVTFTDRIDLRSVNTTTFIVRPVGGIAISGKYSEQTNIVNFWPDVALAANTTYEIVINGIKDYAGNTMSTAFTSRFSTGSSVASGPTGCSLGNDVPGIVGTAVNFSISGCSGSGTIQYSWNFGDGTAATSFSTATTATHTYSAPGHYNIIVTARDSVGSRNFNRIQTVTYPVTATRPTRSSTIIYDNSRTQAACVNPDSDTVTAINATTRAKVFEVNVGKNPRTLALASNGDLWVAVQDAAQIKVINGGTGASVATINLPYASRPYGVVFNPASTRAYVTLEGKGRLLAIDATTRAITNDIDIGPKPRGIAVSGDGTRILVTRFVSPADRGEVREVNASTFAITRTFSLAKDASADSEFNGRGVPNYISSVTISPDGRRALVPSKKDNTDRGQFRDGLALTFENTVRSIVSQLDLIGNVEAIASRMDIDDTDLANVVQFNNLGDYYFVALQGNNRLVVRDGINHAPVTSIDNVGRAPQGLALSTDGTKLFVQNFLGRSISVYDVSSLGKANSFTKLGEASTVSTELLSAQVLTGKKIFYNADDRRMNLDGYISCASCHLDGGSDGRVWDFTDRGEGLRNTIPMTGRRGMGHGNVHWTANFDEIQDFENDIRAEFAGTGFMTDAQFNTGTRSNPLGDRKAAVSADLDALAAFVASLTQFDRSPYRNSNGTLTSDGVAGKQLFQQLNCHSCHSGNDFTDTLMHSVGTIKTSSGKRAGQTLTGVETPTLKGIWDTAPYLHDGSAPTLMDVITTANPNNTHGNTSTLTTIQKQQLVAYLQQIDSLEVLSQPPAVSLTIPANGATFNAPANISLSATATDSDGTIAKVEFISGSVIIASDTSSPYAAIWSNVAAGQYGLAARATDNSGVSGTSSGVNVTVMSTTGTSGGGFNVKINFQPASSAVPAGYLADGGLVYGSRGNGHSYGWNADNTANARDKNFANSPDQRYDTLNHMQKNGTFTWSIAVPNGTYSVRIVAGDPEYFNSVFKISAEGVLVVDGTPSSTTPWIEGTKTITVSDGSLSIGNATGASNNKMCFIEITQI